MVFTGVLIVGCAAVLLRGLRAGIERASQVLIPALFLSLLVLMVRALTLPGAGAGVAWFIGKFEWTAFTPRVVAAAFGQVFFTLSLGGTMMVIYGSYLKPEDRLPGNSAITVAGDTVSGILAGLAILPAVASLGLLSKGEPDLIFVVLPKVFAAIPFGRLVGLIFFLGLLGSGFLSAIAAWEVQVAALTDNTRLSRRQAVWWLALLIFLIALPPMPSQKILLAWDLTFGSGMQTLGSLLAVVAFCWCLDRATVLREIGGPAPGPAIRLLYLWLRFAVPFLILLVGLWWLVSEALGLGGK
jgi:NSS family neurotransmitter:Na+ symporter